MSTPFVAASSLSLPINDGQAVGNIVSQVASSFTAKLDTEVPLTGAGTHSIDVSALMAAGARAVLIELDVGSAVAPVMVRVNGGSSTGQLELSPGGFLLLASPAPVAGVTAIDLVYTSAAKVRVRVLG